MQRFRIELLFASLGFSFVGASAGCDEHCPPGYEKRAGTCYRIKDAGSDAAEAYDEEEDTSLGHGVDPVSPQFDASLGPGANDAGSMVANLDAMSDAAWVGTDASPEAGFDASQLPPSSDTGVEIPKPDAGTIAQSCDPTPCRNGGTCSSAAGAYTCKCADGYAGTNCELEICGATFIRSRENVDSNRLCAEIRGDLNISAVGLDAVTADDFPFLTKVTGDLVISGMHAQSGTGNANLRTVTLAKLQTVEGAIQVYSSVLTAGSGVTGPVDELHLPALTTIGSHDSASFVLIQSTLKVLEMPVLTAMEGHLALRFAHELCVLNIRRLASVMQVTLVNVPRLPASAFVPLRSVAIGSIMESQVGCCWPDGNDRVSCPSILAGCAGCAAQ